MVLRVEGSSFAERLLPQAQKTWDREDIPKPPTELLKFQERNKDLGFTFEPFYWPEVVLEEDSDWPGAGIRPEGWYWQQIRNRNLPKNFATLFAGWYAMESIQKPDYVGGRQLYSNDALGLYLENLRNQGKIAVPELYRHVPPISRFAVSWDEIHSPVISEVSKLFDVDRSRMKIPRMIELNVRGNMAHREWGQTNTLEWFEDKFEDAHRLYGGNANNGGLAHVLDSWSDYRNDHLGFRLLVSFPQQT